jgi:putative SOS response-associated peptidase YedK
MCSRYATPEEAEMARYYRIDRPKLPEFKPLIYPGYDTPTLLNPKGSGRTLEARLWGFVLNMPGKRDPSKMVSKVLQNAVSETIEEKRTFSSAWKNGQRCVLPAKNFLEPKDGKFTPIIDPDLPMLSLAGIWGEHLYKDTKRNSCTMLTCEPNSFMEKFHDRMPVILHPDDVDEWLSPDTTPEQARKLCRPYKGQLAFAI